MRQEIERFLLAIMYPSMGIDRPSNHDEILDMVYLDVLESADTESWNDDDIRIAFRRFLEWGSETKQDTPEMNRDDFMEFFRDEEKLNTLSPDDRAEVFASILTGGSDFTKKFLDEVLSNYEVDHLGIVVKTPRPFLVGDRVYFERRNGRVFADVIRVGNLDSAGAVVVRTTDGTGAEFEFYLDGRWFSVDPYPSLFHA
jgi:hypothetical protein